VKKKGWYQAIGFPSSIISDIKYSEKLDKLYVSILGRGIWFINNTTKIFSDNDITTSTESSITTQTSTSSSKSTTNTETSTTPENPEVQTLKNILYFIVPISVALFFMSIILLILFIKMRSNSDMYTALENRTDYGVN